ncbi:MAG: efflux RND transporter permease subunit [Bacteroidales bacterium]
MSIYATAVRKPITTILIFLGVIIFGLFSLTRLSIDLYPDFDSNQMMVICSYPGANALDVENNVTRIMEDGLNTVDKLKKMSSTSKENFSIVTLEYEWGTDLDLAVNDIRDKLDIFKSQLPEGASTPTIFRLSSSMIPVVILTVEAQESLPALYKTLEDRVANAINRIDGVGSVSISGAPQRQVQVNLDPQKMEAYKLSIERIGQIIGAENLNMPAGSIDIGSDAFSLRVQGEFTNSDELRDLIVLSDANRVVRLGDIAEINDTLQDKIEESYTNAVQGASIVVMKQSGANSVKIAKEIHKALPQIQKTLPPDVKINVLMDTSDNIVNSIKGLSSTVGYAFFFVVLVVLFFLGRWRATFIIILTIPVSLIVSFAYLMIAGETINVITLSSLSIAIGMVVDDAIVVLENITTHIERGSPPKQAAIYATNEVGVAVLATTLTVIAVFFPLTMVGGMAGIMFKPLGWMVTVIIAFSTLAALTLTPMLCSRLLKIDPERSRMFMILYGPIEKMLDALDNTYAKTLEWVLTHRLITIFGSIAIFVGSLVIIASGQIGTEFFPQSDNGRIAATIKLDAGTHVDISKETAAKITELWRTKYPEVEVVNYTVGTADEDNMFAVVMQSNGENIINYNIRLAPLMQRDRDLFTICDSMRADLLQFPEIHKSEVTAGGGSMGGMGATVDLEIYGYDFDITNQFAEDFAQRVKDNVPGAKDILLSREDFKPEYQIEFDRRKLALHGINYSTAAQYVRNRINGLYASKFREEGDEYDIVVRYGKEHRKSIDDIENIIIYDAQNNGVRLAELGKVYERQAPPSIERQDRERIIKVSATASGVPLSVVADGMKAELARMDVPAEIGLKLAGSYEDQQESFGDMGLLLALVVILVYIVMASQFESLSGPFIIMFSLPFALTGIILALWITGTPLGITAAIGGIMLVGIVVKNGIVLVDFINLNRERGDDIFKAVVSGGKSRLRPVLMTTATTILGMIPMAVMPTEGSEIWQPMGIAIIGGLTFSTLLTLLVVPTVYTFFAARDERKKALARKREMQFLNSLGGEINI